MRGDEVAAHLTQALGLERGRVVGAWLGLGLGLGLELGLGLGSGSGSGLGSGS